MSEFTDEEIESFNRPLEQRYGFALKAGEVRGMLKTLDLIKTGFTLEGIRILAEKKNNELKAELNKEEPEVKT